MLFVHLNARLQPDHRHGLYEDPILPYLTSQLPGSAIVGGGTQLGADGEPMSCDIEIDLEGDVDAGVTLVRNVLEACGAPHGSTLTLGTQAAERFGTLHGVAVYLNGTDLAPAVYASSDVNEFIDEVVTALGQDGLMQSFWEGPRETALYVYGSSSTVLRNLLAPVLASHPLAGRCRVVDIT